MKKLILATLVLCGSNSVSHAGEIQVAVAANFTAPMEKIAAAFSQETGHKAVVSSGATGKLYAQVKNGAPFEVFLSADQETVKKLLDEGQGVAGTQFTYAIGKLVLWSPGDKFVDPKGEVLGKGDFKHLAIANPKLAPYGVAAQEVLQKMNIWEKLEPRLVMGENIAQTYQFVETGNAELGFVAYSQAKKDGKKPSGSIWVVPQTMYSPLNQDAVLLQKGKDSVVAKKFLEFLKSKKAKTIIVDFGYELP
jgi:molybdate transport system substrate-binding protein